MGTKNFEGNLSGLLPIHLDLIAKALECKGIGDAKVKIEPVGKAGDNYQGAIKKIIASRNDETHKMIIKTAEIHSVMRDLMNVGAMYRNEAVMYEEVFPKFAVLERQAKIPVNERLAFAACYGASIEEPNEGILLEDLCDTGFTITDRFKTFSNETTKLVVKELAKLHALSFVLKAQEPQTFREFAKKLTNTLYVKDNRVELYKIMTQQLENNYLDMLDKERHKNAIKGLFWELVEFARGSLEEKRDPNSTVIVHSDCWSSNIMFKDNTSVQRKCCFIDYQMVREDLPVWDIYQLLFYCTDYETRAQHFYGWLDFYHGELDNYLNYFGLTAKIIYPREKFDADMKLYAKFAFTFSLFALSFFVRDDSDAVKVKEAMGKDVYAVIDSMNADRSHFTNINLLKERMEGVIDSFLDFGFIN